MENLTTEDLGKQLLAIDKSEPLRAFLMEHLLIKSIELEEKLGLLPAKVDDLILDILKNLIADLKIDINDLNSVIEDLPDNIQRNIEALQQFTKESFQAVKEETTKLETKVETVNAMAINVISKAMLENVYIFEKSLNESKIKVLNDMLEPIKELESITRQKAWITITSVLSINIIFAIFIFCLFKGFI